MNYFVRLHEDSPFFGIFRNGFAPVKQVPLPNTWTLRMTPVLVFVTAALCGNAREPEPVVWLDWKRCAFTQRWKLAEEVTRLRGGTSDEFLTYMDRGGDMPIRVSQTDGSPFPL